MAEDKKKRIITVEQNGQVLYRGEDKRFYNQDCMRCALGIPIIDWLKIGIYVIGVVVVLVRYDARLTATEETQKKMATVTATFSEYIVASDSWHSAYIGKQFVNGAPADGSVPVRNYNERPRRGDRNS